MAQEPYASQSKKLSQSSFQVSERSSLQESLYENKLNQINQLPPKRKLRGKSTKIKLLEAPKAMNKKQTKKNKSKKSKNGCGSSRKVFFVSWGLKLCSNLISAIALIHIALSIGIIAEESKIILGCIDDNQNSGKTISESTKACK